MLGLDTFEFDRNFLARYDVGAEVDVTETSASNLSANPVFTTDPEILL